ncbi:PP2C family protein-serine/threonine phosphatase [Thermodesulfobacteriota bacterium]
MKNLDHVFKTHIGSIEGENGDYFFQGKNLFIVVEGVGGEYFGEIAREQVCRITPEVFFKQLSENNSPGNALILSLEEANKGIIAEGKKIDERMAASVSVVFIGNKIMYFTHLGDSRIYSLHGGELNQLTRDHTLKEEDVFAEKRSLDPRAMRALTEGLGIHEKVHVEVKKYPLNKKGLIIMTTEGLTERVSNREILWLTSKTTDPKKLSNGMIDLAKRKGGKGNMTVGIIRFGGLSRGLRDVLITYSIFFLIIGYGFCINYDVFKVFCFNGVSGIVCSFC